MNKNTKLIGCDFGVFLFLRSLRKKIPEMREDFRE